MLQETLLAAWRGLDRFEGRSSVRAWLYRIATNRCLNALRDSARRPRELADTQRLPASDARCRADSGSSPTPTRWSRASPTLQPGPDARYEAKESIALAFVAGLQHLPPRQRAVLAAARRARVPRERGRGDARRQRGVGEQRAPACARDARLRVCRVSRERAPLPGSATERELVTRFAEAFVSDDVDAVVELLTEDALLTMPPEPLEYQGQEAIANFLLDRGHRHGRRLAMRLVPTRANGQPAFGHYLQDPHAPVARCYGLIVLTLEGERISALTRFRDTGIMQRFGLPRTLPE